MELNHLKVFYEVAKTGKFAEAARRLNISQSALSRSVALLEESEGVRLFERSRRGVALTQLGSEVFTRCEQLFKTFSEIENVCRGTREVCEGPLRFAATDHVVTNLTVEPIQSFRELYPKVAPSIFTGIPDEIAAALLANESEFGVMFAKVPLPQLDYQILSSEDMALVCSPAVWKRNKAGSVAKTLKKVLADVGYIASIGARLQSRPSRVLLELFGEMPQIMLETNSQEAQKRFAIAGGGVAYLSHFMVRAEIESGDLIAVPLEHLHNFHCWLVTKKGRQLSLVARNFIRHLREHENFRGR